MWKSAFVGVYQLLNWKMHSETLKNVLSVFLFLHICVCPPPLLHCLLLGLVLILVLKKWLVSVFSLYCHFQLCSLSNFWHSWLLIRAGSCVLYSVYRKTHHNKTDCVFIIFVITAVLEFWPPLIPLQFGSPPLSDTHTYGILFPLSCCFHAVSPFPFPKLPFGLTSKCLLVGWGCLPHAQPTTWRTKPPYLYFPERGWSSYTSGHWLFILVTIFDRHRLQCVELFTLPGHYTG